MFLFKCYTYTLSNHKTWDSDTCHKEQLYLRKVSREDMQMFQFLLSHSIFSQC